MKQLLFLLLAVALFSCHTQSYFEKDLIRGKWVMFEGKSLKDEHDRWPNAYFRFFDCGEYKNLDVYSDTEEQPIAINGEKIKLKNWSYIPEEDKLIIYGNEFRVLSVKADTIYMRKDTIDFILYDITKTQEKLKKGPGRCLGG
ncbi:MAG: hypothetical protein DI539_00185 [Flavobacterium psychrophilum]|nr:MAG: hypothetical protein DI539_00185 [Flavobacterium psychrophilum]